MEAKWKLDIKITMKWLHKRENYGNLPEFIFRFIRCKGRSISNFFYFFLIIIYIIITRPETIRYWKGSWANAD